MKRLFILRHAKTEPGSVSRADRDRRLLEKGRDAASRMGAYIRDRAYRAESIKCSTAQRTRETCSIVRPFIGASAPIEFREDLYLAEAEDMLSRIQEFDDGLGAVLIVGHNPGVADLALMLSAPPHDAASEALHRNMRAKFSTCSFVVLDFDVSAWCEVSDGSGLLVDYKRPRDLT